MENVSTIMYCEVDMISSSEAVLFECPSAPKVIRISKYMSLNALKKTIMDAIKILLDFFLPPTYLCR